jgi:transposase InsO family protein
MDMKLFRRKQRASKEATSGQGAVVRRRPTFCAMEVKLLALEALQVGLTRAEVAEIVGVAPFTITTWQKKYDAEGLPGLYRHPSSMKARSRCAALERRITERREAHPERGVRRIRDDLRREDGLAVSAETVRKVVNEAGLGNDPVKRGPRPATPRRFERKLPNALWQIDIFTFDLKRFYKVYLIGIIDDHSRYLVGWGLFRQQTAEAVLEVTKGAIGQWGAPREILSDNGRQFVAWKGKTRFQHVLRQQGIGHVRSAPHHPMTLGKIERFWQTVWREFLSEQVFASFADACQRLDHWVQYYNHQRPHQGIEGACPADRFYGVAGDVEEALKQGCEDNALRLALGQEPKRPLYLLGQLGDTDVRVVRRGEDLEIKVGNEVREVISLGAPYEIGEDGHGRREAAPESGEVAGPGSGGEARADRADLGGTGDQVPAVPDFRHEPSGASPCDGGGEASCTGGAGAEASGSQAPDTGPGADRGAGSCDGPQGAGARTCTTEVRDRSDAAGSAAASRPRGAAPGGGEKKQEEGLSGYVGRYSGWARIDDGTEP